MTNSTRESFFSREAILSKLGAPSDMGDIDTSPGDAPTYHCGCGEHVKEEDWIEIKGVCKSCYQEMYPTRGI